jgi:hypothetical protein
LEKDSDSSRNFLEETEENCDKPCEIIGSHGGEHEDEIAYGI